MGTGSASDININACLAQPIWPPLCLPWTPPTTTCLPLPWPHWVWAPLQLPPLAAWEQAPPALTVPLCGAGSGVRGSLGLLSHPSLCTLAYQALQLGLHLSVPHHWAFSGPQPASPFHPSRGGSHLCWEAHPVCWPWGPLLGCSGCLTLAAGRLGACAGGGLCWPAARFCLHLLTALRLLGQVASALCPSGQLFSLCRAQGGCGLHPHPAQGTEPLPCPGTPGRAPELRWQSTSTKWPMDQQERLWNNRTGRARPALTGKHSSLPPFPGDSGGVSSPPGPRHQDCTLLPYPQLTGVAIRNTGPKSKETSYDQSGWSAMLALCLPARPPLPWYEAEAGNWPQSCQGLDGPKRRRLHHGHQPGH